MFKKVYADVANAYEAMGDAVHKADPLDDKTRALIKLSISTGARFEGAVHSHTRKTLSAGYTFCENFFINNEAPRRKRQCCQLKEKMWNTMEQK